METRDENAKLREVTMDPIYYNKGQQQQGLSNTLIFAHPRSPSIKNKKNHIHPINPIIQ